MELIVLLLVLIASCFSQSNALQCYLCSHSKSWKYCEKYRTIHTCPSKTNTEQMCYKMEKYRNFQNKTRDYTFASGCIYSKYCQVSYMCTKQESCKLKCCNTNLCNAGESMRRVHKFYALTGIVASFLIRSILL